MKYKIKELEKEKIEKTFTHRLPSEDQQKRYANIRDKAKKLAYLIYGAVPNGRERSLAILALADCVMFAISGITNNEE